ncbi:MAG: hypothetical protein V4714_07010 [Bacteroidota bacterium]
MMNDEKAEELKYVREILEKEKAAIELKLRSVKDLSEKADLIGKINLIKFSQELLRCCFEHDNSPRDIWRKVPQPEHEWSEYRLLEDYDSDNKEYWREEPDIRLNGGEIIIG